jgi:undecaprenyl-diphosphatase
MHWRLVAGMDPGTLLNWSSFPSDNATLFFCARDWGVVIDRLLGSLALAYVTIAICLPRLYVGIHWPTDLLAGGLLGAGVAQLARIRSIRKTASRYVEHWGARSPGPYHAALFLLTFEIGTVLDEPLQVIRKLLQYWRTGA